MYFGTGMCTPGGARQTLDVCAELWGLAQLYIHVAVALLQVQSLLSTIPEPSTQGVVLQTSS